MLKESGFIFPYFSFSIIHSVSSQMSNDISILPACFVRVLCVLCVSLFFCINFRTNLVTFNETQSDQCATWRDPSSVPFSFPQINSTHRRTEELRTWVANLRNLCVLLGKTHPSQKPKRELLLGKFPLHDREINPRM